MTHIEECSLNDSKILKESYYQTCRRLQFNKELERLHQLEPKTDEERWQKAYAIRQNRWLLGDNKL